MYITTFYSFKGGVGRSMALANVAVELAKRGRRVLTVDFDLEAPGLDTFDVLRPRNQVPGLIDFVRKFLESNQAPDVSEYMSRLRDVDDGDGELWIMPSGAQEATYAAHFNEIDWAELYERRDGYLFFEDLKAQWKGGINPDYVLIDSRTGHTDTGGICTRQLPDAVAILFFPNEQNLRGLRKVVEDIRSEGVGPRKKQIDLHFVMSNVPDLDDEDRILAGKIDTFRRQLDFGNELTVVHRYESLSLLNQAVFTQERPRSRLAEEYRKLVREVVRGNWADRDGALDYIRRTGAGWRRRGGMHESPDRIGEKLHKIEELHSQDGDVLFALGTFFEQDRQLERAGLLFNRAINAGCDEPEAYLRRARARADEDPEGATEDALQVLRTDGLPPPVVREAIRLAGDAGAEDVAQSAAVTALERDERMWLANGLSGSLKEIGIGALILQAVVDDEEVSEERRESATESLVLDYIGLGKCGAAAELIRRGGRDVGDMDIVDAFNYGMAMWGDNGAIVSEPFERVIEQHRTHEGETDANYFQCMSVAHWAVGDSVSAGDLVDRARSELEDDGGREFSCWRYWRVRTKEFLEDMEEIEALIRGDTSRKPHFMRRPVQSSPE